jgi:heme exporter protein B
VSAVRAALAIAGKDLRIEWRHRTALVSAVVFAVLVLLVFIFARDPGTLAPRDLAPSVLWVTLALATLLALNRAFLLEREHGALDGLLLAPVSRASLFWGKWLANLAFVLVVDAIAFPLWVMFFGVDPTAALWLVAGVAVLAAIGFTAVGTTISAMTVRTRFAELLLPVLLLPFLLPPITAAAGATVRILEHRPAGEWLGWIKLLALYDLVFLVLATGLFPRVMDE